MLQSDFFSRTSGDDVPQNQVRVLISRHPELAGKITSLDQLITLCCILDYRDLLAVSFDYARLSSTWNTPAAWRLKSDASLNFIVSVCPVQLHANIDIGQACTSILDAISKGKRSIVVFVRNEATSSTSYAVSLTAINNSLGIGLSQNEALLLNRFSTSKRHWRKSLWSFQSRYRPFIAGMAFVLIFTVMMLTGMAILHTQATDIYRGHSIIFSVPDDNIGPRVREKIRPGDAASWSPAHLQEDDFTIRLDDQTLIPNGSFTDFEIETRDWFIDHWPALLDVYQKGLHLDQDFLLGGEEVNGIQLGSRFHVAHCILHMRRMYKAQVEGVHVSPRDMDMDHTNHCLLALEDFALRDDRWCVDESWVLHWETWVAW